MSSSGFWDNMEKASCVVKELKSLKAVVEPWQNAHSKYTELKELADIATEQDQDLIANLTGDTQNAAFGTGET